MSEVDQPPEADPETGSVAFDYEGSRYTMVFDMKAVAFFEREADESLVEVLAQMEATVEAGKAPKVSMLALLMQAGLRRHHPEVSAERALRMASRKTTQGALGLAVKTAAGPSDAGGREPANPPRKAGTNGPSTSPRGKGTRSKRG